jgi:hypothetical protein
MSGGRNPQVARAASDERGAPTSLAGSVTRGTPIRTIGEHVMTPDMEVPSQVYTGHEPAAAGAADRLARKDF